MSVEPMAGGVESPAPVAASPRRPGKPVKVLVWDLDGTVWDGTLLEGDDVRLRDGVRETLEALDRRGILHSIASRNEPGPALAKLRELGVIDYFLAPRINWGSKALNVAAIAEELNLGLDSFAFIDDQPFERDEVAHSHPQVLTLDAAEVAALSARPEMMPRFLTDESARRREMYRADADRRRAEAEFQGPSEEFLAGLGMRFSIRRARREDLQRAEELTQRTTQLNTTGCTYSYEELDAFRRSPNHLLLVAGLDDRYGSYGTIGLALVETGPEAWNLRLLLMSCRVMSRGVGTVLLHHVMGRAQRSRARLLADFRPNGRNRMMLVTYRFAGFREIRREGDLMVLESALTEVPPPPGYLVLETPEE